MDIPSRKTARPAEEVDVWWGAYAGRTMAPHFVACAVATLLILIMAWSIGAWRGAAVVRYGAELLVAGIWLAQTAVWIYRMLAINYRLTTRHLYCERGFSHPGRPGIDLGHIVSVAMTQGPVERWLGVGRVSITITGISSPLILEGVRHPESVVAQIDKQVQSSRPVSGL
jgi:membrane protein YdbS with pleckstrin-like domain